MADEAFDLGSNELSSTYLDTARIIHIARQSGADAIHPGYGFLSENAAFASAAADAGINFIGPTPELIRLMGDKLAARNTMREIAVPMIPGFEGASNDILANKQNLRYPLLVKAAAGGGGKAMRIVEEPSHLEDALNVTTREAFNYFGNGLLYVEHYLPEARHIEVQVLADHYANYLILGERECSIQRRYQKVIEESPAVCLSEETRGKLHQTALKIIKTVAYNNAGTLEFLVSPSEEYYFLEMNTRIQVEHPVTEAVTGLDLVELQIQIAAGNPIEINQEDIKISGHAIEVRIYAEDPQSNFMPSPGHVELFQQPRMPGLRIDSGIDGPGLLHPEYDPLIAKMIFHAASREEAMDGILLALKKLILHGPANNREFIGEILACREFRENKISTSLLEKITPALNHSLSGKKNSFPSIRVFAAWLGWKLTGIPGETFQSVWEQTGCWRMVVKKSLIFQSLQFDIRIVKSSPSKIVFNLEGIDHVIEIKSRNYEGILFELDGVWSSASVSHSQGLEDIVCIEGLEFRVQPLDTLPKLPYFIDHQEEKEGGTRVVKSPLHGKISRIFVQNGNKVKKDEPLFSLDAMKIENKITSPCEGTVSEIRIKEGEQVQINQVLIIINV